MKKKAVVLLSGGLDSLTALYVALREGHQIAALTLDYGQLHQREISFARMNAEALAIPHQVVHFGLPWKGSSLLDAAIPVPSGRTLETMNSAIPSTYVPARNTIFLALAASYAETLKAEAVFIGANALDYSGYPDCRPDFFTAMQTALNLGTKTGIEGLVLTLKTPLLHLTKAEIIKLGHSLGVPFERTWSCYQGGDNPCGACDACLLRAKGFQEAGCADPWLTSDRDSRIPS
ncbi:MAG: 7-cyano-7-deazaguanine synthase QueC [Candidatus Omnitrophica bacterium]|nr:7-cyano-7-deazaguanine synthase QueC [Candidatus Omnitrophota bacterium]